MLPLEVWTKPIGPNQSNAAIAFLNYGTGGGPIEVTHSVITYDNYTTNY